MPSPRKPRGSARVRLPARNQIEMRLLSRDQSIPADHRVRIVCASAESCDLSAWYAGIRAVAGEPGRDAVDPRLLFALWLFATVEGVTSARRRKERDLPYRWLCGGVSVNYDLRSFLRTAHGDLLEQLMIHSMALLHHNGLIDRTRQNPGNR